jgi:alkyl hydroperoxide reductase subunit AhpC
VLFSHPKEFTPVCTTELGYMAGLKDEQGRLSDDRRPIAVHPQALRHAAGRGAGDTSEGRTPADNATVRSVFLIGPDKKIKLMLTYPMTTGRNFDEILRALDSINRRRSTQWRRRRSGSRARSHHHGRRLG